MGFNETLAVHTWKLGQTVQEIVTGTTEHGVHRHTEPFQLQADFDNVEYHRKGDWMDTYAAWYGTETDSMIIRFTPDRWPGKRVVHCHRLIHENKGMMSFEDADWNYTLGCD